MPNTSADDHIQVRHTDEVQDIIIKTPAWILRWGITLFSGVLLMLVVLSGVLRYPDIVQSKLKIESPNAPKAVISRITGKLTKLLVKDGQQVDSGQILGFMESTGNHLKIGLLSFNLKKLQEGLFQNRAIDKISFTSTENTEFGELQPSYQVFFQAYLNYKSAIRDGFLLRKKSFLEKDLVDLSKQTRQLEEEREIQRRNLSLANDDYEMHKKLAAQRVETQAELRQQESKYLAQKSPLVQTESALISSGNNYSVKQKEILELDNQIAEERSKFLQSLNSLISQIDDWEKLYILTAQQPGKVSFVGVMQENQVLSANQEVLYINPGNESFFGEMVIPQDNLGKVKEGQEVLIKLKSYPFEEYGMIRGRITSIAEVPYKDSVFVSRVDFKLRSTTDTKKAIRLKQGMKADAEIVTQEATVLQRISRSFFKLANKR